MDFFLFFFHLLLPETSAGGHLTLLTTSLAHFLPPNILFGKLCPLLSTLNCANRALVFTRNSSPLFAAPFSGSWVANSSPPLFARFRDRRVVREQQTAGQLQLVKQKGVGQLRHADGVALMLGST